jgi:hypothetical protein
VLECLIEATYTRDRKGQLAGANLGIEKLRSFFRLAVELHYLDRRRYQHAARTLDEIGRLIGGWVKAHAAAVAGTKPADVMAKRHDHLAEFNAGWPKCREQGCPQDGTRASGARRRSAGQSSPPRCIDHPCR